VWAVLLALGLVWTPLAPLGGEGPGEWGWGAAQRRESLAEEADDCPEVTDERVWTAPQMQVVLAEVKRRYDLQGREVRTEWPSGSVVTSTYAPSGEVLQQVLTALPAGPTPVTTVDYTFDPVFGVADGWDLKQGSGSPRWVSRDTHVTSGQVVARSWQQLSSANVSLFDRTLQLEWTAGGRLSQKLFDVEPISYTYDSLGRIERVIDGGPTSTVNFERYYRDAVGNPTEVRQRVSTGQWVWTYAPTASYNEVPSRSRPQGAGTVVDTFGYDGQSRLTTWNTTGAAAFVSNRTFRYDGSGRLRQVVKTGVGATTETYGHDVDDHIPYEVRSTGGLDTHVFRHEGWERRATSAGTWVDTEQVLPMASLRGGELVVLLQELDGHAVATRGPVTQSQELLGAFGLRLSKYNVNPQNWVVHGFQGEEVNRDADVVHKGARHMALRDGLWLQPEPLLYLGLTNGNLASPIGYTGVYAAGDTNQLQDLSGLAPGMWLWSLTATQMTGRSAVDMTLTEVFVANVAATLSSWSAPANAVGDGDVAQASGAEGLMMGLAVVGAAGMVDDAVSVLKSATRSVASKGSATFHKYEGAGLGPTGRHVTVEIKDGGGKSLGEFHQTGAGKSTSIEPVGELSGTRTASSGPHALDDPAGAAKFGTDGFDSGRYVQGKNDCVTGACAVANQGSPAGGQITPGQVRSDLGM
jgi:hypothetical protein